jgi:hypothetical protein
MSPSRPRVGTGVVWFAEPSAERRDGIAFCEFTDVVRHPLVQTTVVVYEQRDREARERRESAIEALGRRNGNGKHGGGPTS